MEGQTETTEPTSPATSGVAPLADAILAAVKTRAMANNSCGNFLGSRPESVARLQ